MKNVDKAHESVHSGPARDRANSVAVRVLSAYAAGDDPTDADIAQLLAVGVLEAPMLAQAVLDADPRFVRVRVIALAAKVVASERSANAAG